MKKIIALAFLLLVSSVSLAGENIGYGYIKVLKVGNYDIDQMSVQFEEGYSLDLRECGGLVFIRASDMSELRFNLVTSILLDAYMLHKKVRLHSHLDEGCNATFVSLEEEHA